MIDRATVGALQLDRDVMNKVRELVYQRSGISLVEGKEQLIESRLRRRLRALDIQDATIYLDFLEQQPAEYEHFVNVFTTNETSFFRTERVWRYIEETLLATWSEDYSKPRQVWSAASSTGEECYSFAMSVDQFNRRSEQKIRVKILGSDISTEVLAKAKGGRYSGRTINRLKAARPELLLSYFTQQGEEYSLRAPISHAVQFRSHNLFKNPPHNGHYDLVLLRNVLIYFNNKDQEAVLSNIHRSLKPGGVLIVGESESLSNLNTAFEFCEPLIYKKKA